MKTYWIKFWLKSDATFGKGDGVAGLVDTEVQHDSFGLPYLSGKTLKGLLTAECSEILSALQKAVPNKIENWYKSAQHLFGNRGSGDNEMAKLHVGHAQIPADLRYGIIEDFITGKLSRENVLESLTAIRRQTSMDNETGASKKETLRSTRVILRETMFESRLDFCEEPTNEDLALLAACIKAFHRAGTERNRGRGKLKAELYDSYPGIDAKTQKPVKPVTNIYFEIFRKEVL